MAEQGSSSHEIHTPPRSAVIGLGYVGLPLALLLIDKGFEVYGIDVDERKIQKLQENISYLPDVSDEDVARAMGSGRFHPGTDFAAAGEAEMIILCVPTPLTAYHTPDLSFLQNAARSVGEQLRQGQIVILESSTYPGTTNEVLRPILEKMSGMRAGKDFYIGYSPERIDPGNKTYTVDQIPKLVSGLTEKCGDVAEAWYSRVFERVVRVSSPEVAEMAKIVENSHRLVNITFVNELALICEQMGIDVWEVIDAAATKPFGFTPYYPGPGIGGHCIPVDPLYLQWKAQAYGIKSQFIALSEALNRSMPQQVADKVFELLAENRTSGNSLVEKGEAGKPRILLYGVAYKKDVNDVRESPALDLIPILQNRGAEVAYCDPYIQEIRLGEQVMHSVELTDEVLQAADCVVILTDHSSIPVERIVAESKLVFDTRNVTAAMKEAAHVYRLGSGKGGSKRRKMKK